MKRDRITSTLLGLYCCMMPFEEAFASIFGSVLRVIGFALIGFVILAYARNGIFIPKYIASITIWIVLMGVSVVWADSSQWWSYFFRIYIVQFILLLVLEWVPIGKFEIKTVENGMIIGAVLASGILVFLPTSYNFTDEGRRTVMLLGSVLDPNIVAAIILLGVQLVLMRFYANHGKKAYACLALAVFLIIGVLYTGSRGALMAFIVGFAVETMLKLRDKGAKRKTYRLLVFAFLCAIVLIGIMPVNLLQSRFSKETILGLNELRNGAHNRYTIWMHSIQLILKKPIIGYGCGNFFSAIETVYRMCASHNLYILLIVEGGVIGLFFFGKYCFKLSKSLLQLKEYSTLGMLVTVFAMALSLDSITYKYFWIALIYARLIIRRETNKMVDDGNTEA